jgi:hypothetical protein
MSLPTSDRHRTMNKHFLGSCHAWVGQARIDVRSGADHHQLARRLRRQQSIRRTAAAHGDGRRTRAAEDHALFRDHRIDRCGQPDQSRGACARLCRGYQIQGRFVRNQGHNALRHRARALSREVGAGQGRQSGSRSIAQAARSGLSTPVRPGEAPGRVARDPRCRFGSARQCPKQD